MRSGGTTGSWGSFSATVHNELIIQGAGTNNGGNSTTFLGQAGRHDAVFYELGNHISDEHSNPITDSLPSGEFENHYQTSTRKHQLLIVCPRRVRPA